MDKTTKDHEWPSIRRFQEARSRQEEADEALKYVGTPDKPYVQKLTPKEQAIKDEMERRAAETAERRHELLEEVERLGIELDSDDDVIYTGPRGGRYRINRRDRKSYDVP